jgi:hypothetical protein
LPNASGRSALDREETPSGLRLMTPIKELLTTTVADERWKKN